ncbi:MAG: polysaccharide biosynthesis/export family protein [Bacteroidales bacterium]|jgi:polysaccharide export outer membrane protein|nr:polysaccharide biosynthesis/export family protein [Bacteroidales bacterium]
MKHLYKGFIFVALASVFLSCKVLTPTVMFETNKDFTFNSFTQTKKATILQPFDQLQIIMSTNNGTNLLEFYSNPQNIATGNSTNNEAITYMIRADSTVKIPTIGLIKLGGISKDSAEVILEQKLSTYYQEPFVKITIVNRSIIMFFEGGTKGTRIPVPEDGITLLEAIAQAGGLTENSKSYKIKLIRGDNTNPSVYNYNVRKLEEFKKANFILQANDIVYVDARPRYARKILAEIQPIVVLFSSAVLVYSVFGNK